MVSVIIFAMVKGHRFSEAIKANIVLSVDIADLERQFATLQAQLR